jgi:hypothetical protein
MRRFILIDPCLCDLGSHPYQYCRDILDAAERSGFACAAVAHRGFRPDRGEWPASHKFEASLSTLGHSKYTAFGELDRLAEDGRARLRIAWPWAARHAERRRRERIDAFAREIEPVVRSVRQGDVVFIATASELDLAGLSRAIREHRPPRGVAWHVQFHYPLYRGFLDDFPRQERRLDRVRQITRRAIEDADPHEIRLHVTTDELASQHRRLGAGDVGVLPYPVRAEAIAAAVARRSRGGRFRISALGDARPEKQSHLLAEVAERIAADPELSPLATLAVQSNLGFPADSRSPADRAVVASLARLSAMPRDRVDLLGGPLMGEKYTRQLAAADAILLAYDQARYRCRCSGVTLEAIASGGLPIVTGGGSMARLLAEPIAEHTATVTAASRALAGGRTGRVRIRAGQPLRMSITIPANATAVLASAAWPAAGDDALQLPGVAVCLDIEGMPRKTLSLQPDRSGRPARGLATLPVPPDRAGVSHPRSMRVEVGPLPGATSVDLDSLAVDPLDTGAPLPCSAAGIVVAPGLGLLDAILDAMREYVRFEDHYRRSAASLAAATAERHSGDAVLRAILEASPLPHAGGSR